MAKKVGGIGGGLQGGWGDDSGSGPGIGSTLEIKVAADVSPLTRAVEQASTTMKAFGATLGSADSGLAKLEKEVVKSKSSWEGLGRGLKSAADTFNEVYDAIGKIYGLMKGAVELAHFSAELRNLEAHVPVKQLKMMQEATEGAVDKITLMKFSMRALGGEMHLTEEGLNVLLEAANNLADQGFGNTTENAEKLLSALRKGKSKELREFAIALDDTADKNQNVNNMLEKYLQLANTQVNVDPQLKAIERFQTAWLDTITQIKAGFGEAIMWFADTLDNAGENIRKADKWLADHLLFGDQWYKQENAGVGAAIGGAQTELARVRGRLRPISQDERNRRGMTPLDDTRGGGFNFNWGPELFVGDFAEKEAKTKKGGSGGKGVGFGSAIGGGWGDILGRGTAGLSDQDFGFGDMYSQAGAGIYGAGGQAGMDALGGATSGLGDRMQEMQDAFAQLQDQSSVVGAAYATMSSGLVAAVDAAISGNESIGKAALKAAASVLKGIALQATGMAAFEVAKAWVFPPAAAYHLAAAAKLAGVAALTGALAIGAGAAAGGGGAPSSAATSAPAASMGGGQGQGGGSTTTVVNISGTISSGDYKKLGGEITSAVSVGQMSGRVRSEGNITVRRE